MHSSPAIRGVQPRISCRTAASALTNGIRADLIKGSLPPGARGFVAPGQRRLRGDRGPARIPGGRCVGAGTARHHRDPRARGVRGAPDGGALPARPASSKWPNNLSELLRDQTARYRHLSVVQAPASEGKAALFPENPATTSQRSTANCWKPPWPVMPGSPRNSWPSTCAARRSGCWRNPEPRQAPEPGRQPPGNGRSGGASATGIGMKVVLRSKPFLAGLPHQASGHCRRACRAVWRPRGARAMHCGR